MTVALLAAKADGAADDGGVGAEAANPDAWVRMMTSGASGKSSSGPKKRPRAGWGRGGAGSWRWFRQL